MATIAKEKDAVLKYIDLEEDGTISLETVKETITPKTKIVSMTNGFKRIRYH